MSSQEQCTWAVYWAQVGLKVGHILGPNWWLVVTFEKKDFNFNFFLQKPMGSILFSHWAILGMEITNNGILMTSDYQGRSSGEAYVQFSSKQDGEKALEKNKQSIGHRLVWLGMGPLWHRYPWL